MTKRPRSTLTFTKKENDYINWIGRDTKKTILMKKRLSAYTKGEIRQTKRHV